MEKIFLDYIKKNKLIKKGDRVLVACSGGADSVALLVLLNKFHVELGFSLVAGHVNHNIRGDEAKRDEEYVKELSNKLGVECVIKSVDVPSFAKKNKKTIEQAARELRYQALREIEGEVGANKIAVAHNSGDQTESILMHLFRGSGISGVSGMQPQNGDIIRPLLEFCKADLISYLKENEVEYKEDKTNVDINYSRNYMRHKVIADVEKIYPAASLNICKFAKKIKEVEDYIDQMLPKHLILKRGNSIVLKNEAEVEHKVILTRLIFLALDMINSRVDIEEKHIAQLVDLFKLQVGKKINLPNGVVVIRVQDGILFEVLEENNFISQKFKIEDEIKTELGNIYLARVNDVNFGGEELFFDADKVPAGAVWRKIKNGDKFTKFSGGTKTLAKFLTDKKIDASMRQKMVVLASEDEILVVPGIEISVGVKITNETKNIAKVKLIRI